MVHHHVVHVATAGGVRDVGGHPITRDLPNLRFQRTTEVVLVLAAGLHVHIDISHVLDVSLVSQVGNVGVGPGLGLLPRISHHIKLLRRAVPQAQVHMPGALGVVDNVFRSGLGRGSLQESTDHKRDSFTVVSAWHATINVHTTRLDASLIVPSTAGVVRHLLALNQPGTVQPGHSAHKPREGHHRESIRLLTFLRLLMVHDHHPVVGEGHCPEIQRTQLNQGSVGGGSLGGADHRARHANQLR
mmetsp:Transcript_90299/g.206496  ORF Transcript_90299/g.206496 Transcript_90299/m.206496 type:complete len:244 (+) Transcript_90299:301-1032(+)